MHACVRGLEVLLDGAFMRLFYRTVVVKKQEVSCYRKQHSVCCCVVFLYVWHYICERPILNCTNDRDTNTTIYVFMQVVINVL